MDFASVCEARTRGQMCTRPAGGPEAWVPLCPYVVSPGPTPYGQQLVQPVPGLNDEGAHM